VSCWRRLRGWTEAGVWPALFADRGYDHDIYRRQLRARGITPRIARRGVAHGSRLGRHRWVVERGVACLHASNGYASVTGTAPTSTSDYVS
jgi:IS5 family transposase